jgi:hypothetical protein
MAGFDGGNDFFSGEIAEDLSDFRTRPGRANRILHWRARNPAWRTLRTGVQRSTADNIPVLRVFGGAGRSRGTRNCADGSPFSRDATVVITWVSKEGTKDPVGDTTLSKKSGPDLLLV